MARKKAKAIPYFEVKRIVENCKKRRTRALIAFQYVMGARAGELAKNYTHKVQKLTNKKKQRKKGERLKFKRIKEFVTGGITRNSFEESSDKTYIEWSSPNFKNKGKTTKEAFVARNEEWFYKPIAGWLKRRKGKKYLFNLKQSRIKELIDTELKKYDESYSTHCLRHSRATYIARATKNPFAVQAILGHADIKTSSKYVNIGFNIVKQELIKKKPEEFVRKKI